MKRLVALLLLLAFSPAARHSASRSNDLCQGNSSLKPRPHSVSIVDFGAVGDGKTLNTVAFQNAIFYLKSFADKGGAQLYVPAGRWLTKGFSLTSNLTLFIERGATIIAAQDYARWEVDDSFPSYGRGNDVPNGKYRSLISAQNLSDVVITGDNGTIDGQGIFWWEHYKSGSVDYSRPHLIELVDTQDVIISNLTFVNSPGWSIHLVYCSKVVVRNITVFAPPDSPDTNGIVPDSSQDLCVKESNISVGHDAIALRSGWDEYGYGKPSTNVHITSVHLRSNSGAGLAFGSQMSGGISNVFVDSISIENSLTGVAFRVSEGRDGYVEDVLISDAELKNVYTAFSATTGQAGTNSAADRFGPSELPALTRITLKNIVGSNISFAGNFSGTYESPFTSICLSNISLSITSEAKEPWICSNVSGFSDNVYPEPCPDLQTPLLNSTSSCFALSSRHPTSLVAVL
uniref:Rhamnogalacturonase A/B/Epimerase-like pectate lyase domain-containing protein n=1 Tax=Kalanchoe fedtschenkoi TaxID=63787 RepID=A0A7N0ZWA9_KALFE